MTARRWLPTRADLDAATARTAAALADPRMSRADVERAVIVTWRWWRSSEFGRYLVAEHLVCEGHGAEFAARHRIPVDPAGEVEARNPNDAEMAALEAEGRHCDWPACRIPAAWIFTQSYTVRGEAKTDEDLSCDRYGRAFASRLHVSIAPAPEGGSQ